MSVNFNDCKQYKSVTGIVYKGIIQAYKTNHGEQGVHMCLWCQVGNSVIKSREQWGCNRFSKSLFLVSMWGVWGHGNTRSQGHTITGYHRETVETRYQGLTGVWETGSVCPCSLPVFLSL